MVAKTRTKEVRLIIGVDLLTVVEEEEQLRYVSKLDVVDVMEVVLLHVQELVRLDVQVDVQEVVRAHAVGIAVMGVVVFVVTNVFQDVNILAVISQVDYLWKK